jgi:ribose/xylose/arabinose/galactoside ABC-type transport system permease subunit
MKNFIKTSSLFNLAGLVLAWIAIFAFFWWQAPPNFHSLDNFKTMARQDTIVSIATLGMTCIIISGGIDLSVGSVVAFVTVVIALVLQPPPRINPGNGSIFDSLLTAVERGAQVLLRPAYEHPWAALIIGILAAAMWGFVNGMLITRLKVVPFIVTLGTYLLVRGAAKGLAHNHTIDSPTSWLNDLTSQPTGGDSWRILPTGVWLTIIFAIMVAVMLKRTRFGRHIVAVGSNEQAARLCGVPIERVKLVVYILAGLMVGLAGLMQYSRLTLGDPTAADGLELKVIAAVVIGGASLNGGQGSILGSLLGAWIMTTISTGCAQMGLDNWVEQMVTGAIIVISVAVDRLRVRKD